MKKENNLRCGIRPFIGNMGVWTERQRDRVSKF